MLADVNNYELSTWSVVDYFTFHTRFLLFCASVLAHCGLSNRAQALKGQVYASHRRSSSNLEFILIVPEVDVK